MTHAAATADYQTFGSPLDDRPERAVQAKVDRWARHIRKPDAPRVPATVHIVDPDRDLRRQLTDQLRCVGYQVHTYGELGSFLRAGRSDAAECLVIDAELTWSFGGAERQQLSLDIDIPFVMMASRANVAVAVEAMKAGAIDFLEKPLRESKLLGAVAAAVEADSLHTSSRASRADMLHRYETLSRRERQVMAFVTAGLMNKQVAWELGISEITVKVHRGSAMRKMAAATLTDLVRMADAIVGLNAKAQSALAARSATSAVDNRHDQEKRDHSAKSFIFHGTRVGWHNVGPMACDQMA